MSDDSWTTKILNLHNDTSFQREVAQIRAKALLKEVSGEIPPFNWNYVPARVVRNVTAATFSLEALSFENVARLKNIEMVARQFALAWESLAKLGERTSTSTALINAAIAYELAGYQANAACLARKIGRPLAEISTPKITDLASKFLQRLFIQVLLLSGRVRKEPRIEETTPSGLFEAIAIAMAGQGFAFASNYLLNGDRSSLDKAKRSLSKAEKSLASLGFSEEANIVRGIASVLPIIQEKSIWSVLASVVEDSPRWKRYLRLLARGTGRNVLNSPSISELWPSQLYALAKGLLSSSSSKVIKMPTSSGKTRIAELAIVHTLVTKRGSKCVYIAPYRALVYELERAFLYLFGDLGFRVSSVIGTYETDDFGDLLTADADILVMTPEKLDLLQRAQPEFLDNVHLFVLDEGQIVQDQHRGAKFELLLTRLKRRLPNARFLFLSAVVSEETLEDFAQWFNASPKDDVMTTDWRPSIQRVAKFEWQREKGVIRYSPGEDISLLKEFVSGVIKQNTYEFTNIETGRINKKRFPETSHKSQTAAELAYRFAELGPVLVFCSQTNFVEAVAKALESRLDLARKTGKTIPSYLSNSVSTKTVSCAREWLGDNHRVTGFFKKGIAVHHGKLPDILRKAIEDDFRNRNFRILIATNTLAQGVNLPIRTVIVHSCWRHRIEELPERIPARDYWNIAGRAGRAGRETEGTIIHIVMSRRDEKDYQYYLRRRRNVEAVQSALFKMLVDLIVKHLDPDIIGERLDPEILALLVEEKTDTLSDEIIKTILDGTLVQKQAARLNYPIEGIQKVFQDTAENIKQRIPDTSYWPIYSSTGLHSNSCEILRDYINVNKDRIIYLLKEARSKHSSDMIAMFLEACVGLPEMLSNYEFGGSNNELLERWLSGTGINEIVAEFGDQAPSLEELARFIEDFFTYRLPWGISAFLRIATKELEFDDKQLSDFAVFFPTMIKFGVPMPSAAWAISAGIPFRKSAIDIATKYLEQAGSPDIEDFREWLGKLREEELRYEFGFEGTVLETVSRALSMSSSNKLLKDSSLSEEIMPYETDVRGIAYENRAIVASRARLNQPIELVRDYANRVDHNAVKVNLYGETLGYVERDLAQLIAPDIDCGLTLAGKIIRIERRRVPKITIRIEIGIAT